MVQQLFNYADAYKVPDAGDKFGVSSGDAEDDSARPRDRDDSGKKRDYCTKDLDDASANR